MQHGPLKINALKLDSQRINRSFTVTSDPPRNYHVFYYLLMGASQDEREEFHLSKLQDYSYLSQVPVIVTPHSRGGGSELLINTPQLILSDRGKPGAGLMETNHFIWKRLIRWTSGPKTRGKKCLISKSYKIHFFTLHYLQFQDDKKK